jgi:hypothetical protein
MTTHQIPSRGADWESAMKTKELYSRHHLRHGDMRAGRREEDSNRPQTDRIDRTDRTDRRDHLKYDHSDFSGRVHHDHNHWNRVDNENKIPLPVNNYNPDGSFSYTRIEISYTRVFNGNNDNYDKDDPLKAFEDFSKAALDFINKPGEKSYQALNDAMKNLMDSRFTSSHIGGNAQISIFKTKNSALVSFQMEVTPAPRKSLEEAREALHKNYNEETYTDYIRALSEKFKQDGVIEHTNDTPTTPVFKASIIFTSKSETKGSREQYSNFHELRRPEFSHRHHGRFRLNNRDFSIGKLEDWQKDNDDRHKHHAKRIRH